MVWLFIFTLTVSDLQRYIQQKKEERHRKTQQEQKFQEREAQQREEKLKNLYETQRRRVEANLRLKEKHREILDRAELVTAKTKALTDGIHIHVHETQSVSGDRLCIRNVNHEYLP